MREANKYKAAIMRIRTIVRVAMIGPTFLPPFETGVFAGVFIGADWFIGSIVVRYYVISSRNNL